MSELQNEYEMESQEYELVEEVPVNISFDDPTLHDTGGSYDAILKLMAAENEPANWCLRSRVTIVHQFGIADLNIEFYHDGHLVIVDFTTSVKDPMSNFDLRTLNEWCVKNGWGRVNPSAHVIREMPDFWRHMWEVNSIDSSYLEQRYGKRPADVEIPEVAPAPVVQEKKKKNAGTKRKKGK